MLRAKPSTSRRLKSPSSPKKSTSFRPSANTKKFTRIIDASLSHKNEQAKINAGRNVAKIKAQMEKNLENPELQQYLKDSEAKAQRHKSKVERKMRTKDQQHPFSAYNFTLTIIGRPNVGKSSLYNRLTGEKTSFVHNSSGVTRDWNHSAARLANLDFQVVDTAGLEEAMLSGDLDEKKEKQHLFGQAIAPEERSGTSPLVTHKNKFGKSRLVIPRAERTSNYALGRPLSKDLQETMLSLTSNAVEQSDILIFIADSRQGVTTQDQHFSKWLRRQLVAKYSKDNIGPDGFSKDFPISSFNKFHGLLVDEMQKPEVQENIANLQLQRILDEAHLENLPHLLSLNHSDRSHLRKIHAKPVIVLANKYDYGTLQSVGNLSMKGTNMTPDEILSKDFAKLGFSDPIPFSAIHGTGMGELYSKMVESMAGVLKQWDVYQKKVSFIQDVYDRYTVAKAKQDKIAAKEVAEIEARESSKKEFQQAHRQLKIAERKEFEAVLNGKKKKIVSKVQSGEESGQYNIDGSEDDAVDPINEHDVLEHQPDLNPNELESFISKHNRYDQYIEAGDDLNLEHHDEDSNNINNHIEALPKVNKQTIPGAAGEDAENQVKFVVVGRPNAGKSTLINALVGTKRLLTGPQPGVTRDSIKIDHIDSQFPNHTFQLIDTAGLKGITQHQHSRFDLVDSSAMQSTLKSVQKANVVALVVDVAEGLYGNQGVDPIFANQIHKNFIENVQSTRFDSIYQQAKARGAKEEELALMKRKHKAEKTAYDDKLNMLVSRVAGCVTKQDMDIARLVAEHGKALLVIANKIDRLKGGQEEVQSVMKGLLALFSMTYAQNKGVTILPVSALHTTNTNQIITRVATLFNRWDSRINTGMLNRWLKALTQISPPPSVGSHQIALKYITQTNTRPPTFALFVNRKVDFPVSYERFIRNSLINEFKLQGIPVRLNLRTGTNPYVAAQTLSSAEKYQFGKRKQREEVKKIKQNRGGKHNKALHGSLRYTGRKPGTASQRAEMEQQMGKGQH